MVATASATPCGLAPPESIGGVRFASHEEVRDGRARLRGYLSVVVSLGPVALAGRLREWIDDAVESALETRRAPPPPGATEAGDLDDGLSDQLSRARQVGCAGLVLCVPSLRPLTTAWGTLDPNDSAVLRFWMSAARERPVEILLDEADRDLLVYPAPVTLASCVEPGAPPQAPPEPRPSSSLPPSEPTIARPPVPLSSSAEGRSAEDEGAEGAASPDHRWARRGEWRVWAEELEAARGPKPLAAVERLFVSRYVPLSDAVARGEADAAAGSILSAWSASFAKSYGEAFGALRVTGKRPLMVLDVPQLAGRIARLHGAKSTHLLLVDALRFDLGLRLHERLRKAMAGRATCAERVLLWSALPTSTPTQLDLLARGPEGLQRMRASTDEAEEDRLGGRGASIPRRVKVGGRDLLKVDLVEARLHEAGPTEADRLDAIADELAVSLANYMGTLAPRTLAFVFGDHGFRLSAAGGGTGPGSSGGASPDEVLVPGFTWLVGDVH